MLYNITYTWNQEIKMNGNTKAEIDLNINMLKDLKENMNIMKT